MHSSSSVLAQVHRRPVAMGFSRVSLVRGISLVYHTYSSLVDGVDDDDDEEQLFVK